MTLFVKQLLTSCSVLSRLIWMTNSLYSVPNNAFSSHIFMDIRKHLSNIFICYCVGFSCFISTGSGSLQLEKQLEKQLCDIQCHLYCKPQVGKAWILKANLSYTFLHDISKGHMHFRFRLVSSLMWGSDKQINLKDY